MSTTRVQDGPESVVDRIKLVDPDSISMGWPPIEGTTSYAVYSGIIPEQRTFRIPRSYHIRRAFDRIRDAWLVLLGQRDVEIF